jgi:hypothetical protein
LQYEIVTANRYAWFFVENRCLVGESPTDPVSSPDRAWAACLNRDSPDEAQTGWIFALLPRFGKIGCGADDAIRVQSVRGSGALRPAPRQRPHFRRLGECAQVDHRAPPSPCRASTSASKPNGSTMRSDCPPTRFCGSLLRACAARTVEALCAAIGLCSKPSRHRNAPTISKMQDTATRGNSGR